MLNDVASLALVLAILVEPWIKAAWLGDTLNVATLILAGALGLEMLWHNRQFIPLRVNIIVFLDKRSPNNRNTKWPLS